MSDSITRTPLGARINFRVIIFAAVVLFMIGYPAYLYLEAEITHGVKDIGHGYKEVDLKQMSSFDFDQTHGRIEDVPKQWRELNGVKVVMYGEMWSPSTIAPQLAQFDLCYSIAKCCFSGPPQVQHFVKSRVPNGTVTYYGGMVKVTGTLHVDVKQGPYKVESIYQLDVEQVEPVM